MTKVSLTGLRRNLTRIMPLVIEEKERVVIWRHRTPVAALVTMDDLDRLWSWEDEDMLGPIVDPETGKRKGGVWVKATGWTPDRPPLKPRPPEAGGPEPTPPRRRWWQRFWWW